MIAKNIIYNRFITDVAVITKKLRMSECELCNDNKLYHK